MITQRLNLLRQQMERAGVDVYYFNTSDFHLSEYVPEYFKTLAYFSGFSGSLATFLVTRTHAYIFVDGRYHLQADQECRKYGIEVIKLGTGNALPPEAFLKRYYGNKTVGLDGRCTSVTFVKKLLKEGIRFKTIDLYSHLFQNRQPLSTSPVYELDNSFTGLSRRKKMEMINYCLDDKVHIVNNLESIAYVLNLRGDDVVHTPVFLAYLVIMDKRFYLFTNLRRFSAELLDSLYSDNITIRPYATYYDFLEKIENRQIIIDENKVNYDTYATISANGNTIINKRSIIEEMKMIKNPVEQKNMELAHIYDGVAIVRFLLWLEKIDKATISEFDAAKKIDSLRMEYMARDLSFDSIVAYNANAAQMHYKASLRNAVMLDNSGTLLFDTGGQYFEGTTDVTRTVALGAVDEEVKMYYTMVLKSLFNLSEAKFPEGLNGSQIDILARRDLWAIGVDYRCGTGHGVGYNLSVHEFPPNIRYMHTDNESELAEIKPGMIFSDEPGVYFDGRFGIRLENLLLCQNAEKNEYGQFLSFRTLTLAPFDRNLIDKRYLDKATIKALNNYHERVYNTLLPYLNQAEAEFLRKLTRAI